jgi:hypothetical protein
MHKSFWIAGLVVGWSGVAAAQEPSLMIPSDREASAQVASIIASARAANLPTNPIVGKVNYGVKVTRSSPGDIVRAASTVKTRLETAREALDPNPTEREIIEGAGALAEQATTDALRAVRRAGGKQSVAEALGLLTQLLSTNVDLPKATQMVTDFLRKGATPAQFVAVGNEISADIVRAQGLASTDARTQQLIATLAAERAIAAAAMADGLAASGGTKSGTSATPPNPPARRP